MTEQKIAQALAILEELNLDAWMVVDQESDILSDPMMDYVVGAGVTWLSFFLFFRSGQKIAIVGNLDIEKFQKLHLFDEVVAYKQNARDTLLTWLDTHDPQRIAIDYSLDSPAADGLTHGKYLKILEMLQGTAYASRLVSAERLVATLRGRKSAEEVRRLRLAINHALAIFAAVSTFAKAGMSEKELAAFMSAEREKLGLKAAWDESSCPSVFTGPQTVGAHSGPTDAILEQGHVFNIDFGVSVNQYCSDLQRTWYILRPGEKKAPEAVGRGFTTIVQAIARAFAALKPGARGVDIDHTAREYIMSQGYDEYPHALGHQVGRSAHDAGALLAPAWERYGQLPFLPLEAGQVFTLEPRLTIKDHGIATVEEMVLITEAGAEFLSRPQTELYLIH